MTRRCFLKRISRLTDMTAEKTPAERREALRAKRETLRAQQAERMVQARHAEDAARFQRYLGAALEQAGVRHELLWRDDTRKGLLTTYPIGFASIRWDLVPHAVSTHGGTDEGMKALFDEALRALGIASHTPVIIDWCIQGLPRVVLSAGDASTHAVTLMRHSSDTWVYAEAEAAPWVIEIYHEGVLTYADRPGLPEHAGDGWRPKRRGTPRAQGGP